MRAFVLLIDEKPSDFNGSVDLTRPIHLYASINDVYNELACSCLRKACIIEIEFTDTSQIVHNLKAIQLNGDTIRSIFDVKVIRTMNVKSGC